LNQSKASCQCLVKHVPLKSVPVGISWLD